MSKRMRTQRTEEIDLIELFKYLWKHIVIIIALTLIAGVMSFLITVLFIKPTYESYVQIYVNNTNEKNTTGYISTGDISAAKSLVGTYTVILKSDTTLKEVASRLKESYTVQELSQMISANAVNNTEIFRVTVRSSVPETAQLIANTVASVLPGRISEVVDGSSVRIVDYAELPDHKASPSVSKNTVIGLFVGLFLGLAICTISFLTDDVIHDIDYIKDIYDLPILGVIPDAYEEHAQKYYKKYYGKTYGSGYSYSSASMKGAK